jgi:hypothetical protein
MTAVHRLDAAATPFGYDCTSWCTPQDKPPAPIMLLCLQVDHELDTQNFEHFDEDMSMQVS